MQVQTNTSLEAPPKRVLVAEDSPVTQDLLKLILSQRGHVVDIADDGEQALTALEKTDYDVALIDFHLPMLDGLGVAQRYRKQIADNQRAQLIAITADVEGLLAHSENCENFDQIIPKPLDVYDVCNVIENVGDAPGAMVDKAHPDDLPMTEIEEREKPRHVQPASPQRTEPGWAIGFELLRWPDDFQQGLQPGAAVPAFRNLDSKDAILLKAPAKLSDLSVIWERPGLHLFPVIDLDGSLGAFADYDASGGHPADADQIRQLIQAFHQKRAQLHADMINAIDLDEKLLGRIFVEDKMLATSYDPASRSLVRYNVPLESGRVIPEAEKLCRNGFLRRVFFDRFHICYRCSSSRLHIREECPKCRSANLSEEAYIHHFKCGHQGIEPNFRHGDTLLCPKCRHELTHFSVDYDKPGTALVCGNCNNTESEPAIGFVCLDCAAQFESDVATTTDIYNYELTQEGLALLQMGNALRGAGQRTIRFSDLPLDFIVTLNGAARRFNEEQVPFTVVNLAYGNEREIVREAGLRQFAQTRELFLENLTNELRDQGAVVRGNSYDFGLINAARPDEARTLLDRAISDAAANLSVDLGIRVHLFGHEDFA